MKYIIDIDALKDCLDLLPTSYSDIGSVDLNDVKKMIDRFPKEEYIGKAYYAIRDLVDEFTSYKKSNEDIQPLT